jgi:hypothetical protein
MADTEIRIRSSNALGFSSGSAGTALDSAFSRISAGLIGVGTGAAGSVAGSLSLTSITHADAGNIILGTATGTKIGTATNQKIGFFNAAPVVQQTLAAAASDAGTTQTLANSLRTALINLGLGA